MYPPGWVCEALYKINHSLRMGWVGREKRYEDELNPGSFAVIQLYHRSDIGFDDEIKTYREFWDRKILPNEKGIVQFVPAYRGPLFDRYGGSRIDYDPITRVPIFVCTIDENYHHKDGRPMDIGDVFNGTFLDTIRYWLVPVQRRVREKYRELGKKIADTVQGVGEEAGKHLHFEANKSGHTGQTVAKKFIKDEMRAVNERHEKSRASLENYYLEHI